MSYSEAFMGTGGAVFKDTSPGGRAGLKSDGGMGTGRKQTDVEKLADDVDSLLTIIAAEPRAQLIACKPSTIERLRDLLAEASDHLVEAQDILEHDGRSHYAAHIHNFLTRIAPLVKQHRGE